MFGLPIAFATPWLLTALLSLPVIWWLLRLTPPRPQQETFPPTRILARLREQEETPARSPWWLTLLRLAMAALVIIAMAGPILNPQESSLAGKGPVMLIVDDGWASAPDWEIRQQTAQAVIEDSALAGRTLVLLSTTGNPSWPGETITPDAAGELMRAASARPLEPDHLASASRLEALLGTTTFGDVVFLSDGLRHEGSAELAELITGAGAALSIFSSTPDNVFAIEAVENNPRELSGTLLRTSGGLPFETEILARDSKGLVVARTKAVFESGEKRSTFNMTEPVELRNQIARIETGSARNAAAVQLLDESNRRRLVGLISGETFDQSQPLLSSLYYISRALEPFSDIRRSDDANVAASVPDLINQGVSAIVLADVGILPDETAESLEQWISKGGMLIRFSGPRLGASPDTSLLPVEIRPGDRNLGGALSWETPKPLAPFGPESPFFGLDAPRDVLVSKQLLALQEAELDRKTWAVLDDGTPLVTADKRGAGWIVLFHVGSDTDWSNLPLSGTFVEMLRRTVNLANAGTRVLEAGEEVVLPPLRLLDGSGAFVEPAPSSKPLVLQPGKVKQVSNENFPGLYGTEDGFEALNLIEEETELVPLDAASVFPEFTRQAYLSGMRFELKSWLLLATALLLLADCIAVLWMAGALRRRALQPARTSTALAVGLVFLAASCLTMVPSALAQGEDGALDYSAALQTRLAYVVTGIEEIDEISLAGMRGLTRYIASRTALEPGEPIGLDLATDELAFYSLIYWPVDPRAEVPLPATMARVDAFMKEGGSILFDTRDEISGVLGGTSASPGARALQEILSGLDVPPLEPVPEDHVLTKAFYLLDDFPGRFSGGDLWVEVSRNDEELEGRPARVGDGVSSILITSNDLAGAWAVDDEMRPLLPTIPADPTQRNYAFRAGVNLMMYALTGNYKSDQVHLPALLERLGQ